MKRSQYQYFADLSTKQREFLEILSKDLFRHVVLFRWLTMKQTAEKVATFATLYANILEFKNGKSVGLKSNFVILENQIANFTEHQGRFSNLPSKDKNIDFINFIHDYLTKLLLSPIPDNHINNSIVLYLYTNNANHFLKNPKDFKNTFEEFVNQVKNVFTDVFSGMLEKSVFDEICLYRFSQIDSFEKSLIACNGDPVGFLGTATGLTFVALSAFLTGMSVETLNPIPIVLLFVVMFRAEVLITERASNNKKSLFLFIEKESKNLLSLYDLINKANFSLTTAKEPSVSPVKEEVKENAKNTLDLVASTSGRSLSVSLPELNRSPVIECGDIRKSLNTLYTSVDVNHAETSSTSQVLKDSNADILSSSGEDVLTAYSESDSDGDDNVKFDIDPFLEKYRRNPKTVIASNSSEPQALSSQAKVLEALKNAGYPGTFNEADVIAVNKNTWGVLDVPGLDKMQAKYFVNTMKSTEGRDIIGVKTLCKNGIKKPTSNNLQKKKRKKGKTKDRANYHCAVLKETVPTHSVIKSKSTGLRLWGCNITTVENKPVVVYNFVEKKKSPK